MVPFIALLLVVLAVPSALMADQSHQHDQLTPQELGAVHFPVSCSPAAQKRFDEGVALLHSFAFDTAERTFRQVLNDDEHCAMAHWGIAKSMWRWDTPDASKREQGLAEIDAGNSSHPGTARERGYLAALGEFYARPKDETYKREEAFTTAMDRLHHTYPDDHEAATFYAGSLIVTDDHAHANRRKASSILEELFKLEPNHPGVAHYLIHVTTFLEWLHRACPPHGVTPRLLRPLRTRCTCPRIFLLAWDCGRKISIPTSRLSPPAAMRLPPTWRTKGTNITLWRFSFTPIFKVVGTRRRVS